MEDIARCLGCGIWRTTVGKCPDCRHATPHVTPLELATANRLDQKLGQQRLTDAQTDMYRKAAS